MNLLTGQSHLQMALFVPILIEPVYVWIYKVILFTLIQGKCVCEVFKHMSLYPCFLVYE